MFDSLHFPSFQDPYRHSSSSDEQLNRERYSPGPWINDFITENADYPLRHNNYRNIPEVENFSEEVGCIGIKWRNQIGTSFS